MRQLNTNMKPISYGKLLSSLPETVRELYAAIERTVKTREQAILMSSQLRTISTALELHSRELPTEPPQTPAKIVTVGDYLKGDDK